MSNLDLMTFCQLVGGCFFCGGEHSGFVKEKIHIDHSSPTQKTSLKEMMPPSLCRSCFLPFQISDSSGNPRASHAGILFC